MDPWHTLWIPYAFSDRLLFHACISKFTTHAAALGGGVVSNPDILRHKVIAIQQMLKITEEETPPDNQVLVAGICLVGIEVTVSLHSQAHQVNK